MTRTLPPLPLRKPSPLARLALNGRYSEQPKEVEQVEVPDPFAPEDEPTKPNGIEHTGAELLRDWRTCTLEDRALIQAMAKRLRRD